MKKHHHFILWGLGVAGGGYALYRFVYVPYAQAAEAAGVAPSVGGMLSSIFAPGAAPVATVTPGVLTTPTIADSLTDPFQLPLPTATTTGVTTSLGPQYSGAVGACIAAKGNTWTADQCQTRLDALATSINNADSQIANFSSNVSQAQQTLTASQAALAQAQTAYNAALASGDAAGAQAWLQAIQGHQSDIASLSQRISAAPGQLAAWQAAKAAAQTDYQNLAGQAA